MSKVTYPGTNQGGNNYPYNYGSGGSEGYAIDPRLQAWVREAKSYKSMYVQYLENLSRDGIDASERQAYQTVMGYLNQLNGQLVDYGIDMAGWDPLAGGGFSGVGEGNPVGSMGSLNPGIPASYQDNQKILYGEDSSVPSFTADKNVSQAESHFYDYGEMTFNVPGSAKAAVSYDKEKDLLTATVTWPSGATKTYSFHHNKKVRFLASDKDRQITLDVSVPSEKAEKGEVGKEGERSQAQGTPPDAKDTNTWSENSAVDYYVTKGAETQKIAATAVDFTLENYMQTAYVTKLSDHKYRVEVKDGDGKTVRIVEINARSINFKKIDADNLYVKDENNPKSLSKSGKYLAITKMPGSNPGNPPQDTGDFIPWSDSNHAPMDEIRVDGFENKGKNSKDGEPLHAGDTPPDPGSVKNGEATYTGGNSNIEIHADDDEVKTYHVSTAGNILLHGATPNDKVHVEVGTDANDEIIRTFTFTSPDGTKHVVKVKGNPASIVLDTKGEVTGAVDGGDVKISIGNNFDTTGSSEFKELWGRIQDASGGEEEAILKQIVKSYSHLKDYDKIGKGGNGDGKLSVGELEKAYKEGRFAFPPEHPDQNLIEFIYSINSKFKSALDEALLSNPDKNKYRKATKELVDALKALYPEVKIGMDSGDGNWVENDITFGAYRFDYTTENGRTNDMTFRWRKAPYSTRG